MNSGNLKNILLSKRNKLGYSHQDVADKVMITRQFYGMLENGERRPSVDVAIKIGALLNIDWTIFFGRNSN